METHSQEKGKRKKEKGKRKKEKGKRKKEKGKRKKEKRKRKKEKGKRKKEKGKRKKEKKRKSGKGKCVHDRREYSKILANKDESLFEKKSRQDTHELLQICHTKQHPYSPLSR